MTVRRIANIRYGEFKLRQYVAEEVGMFESVHRAAIVELARAAWGQYAREPNSVEGDALSDILEDLRTDLEALRALAAEWSDDDRAAAQREFEIVTL